MSISVHQFPVLNDNYLFIVVDAATKEAAIVDPAVAEPVIDFAQQNNIQLKHIINTHHHPDHVGANLELKEKFNLTIWGSGYDPQRIPGIDKQLKEGDEFVLGDTKAQVLYVPGHTLGHIAYHFADDQILFIGDTLFALGCGRLFEGTPEQMRETLQRLAKLPPETKVYCAHEYTEHNGNFALEIGEQYGTTNNELLNRMEKIRELRKNGQATVPTTIDLEMKTNPFLLAKNLEDFTAIRTARNNF